MACTHKQAMSGKLSDFHPHRCRRDNILEPSRSRCFNVNSQWGKNEDSPAKQRLTLWTDRQKFAPDSGAILVNQWTECWVAGMSPIHAPIDSTDS
jgi:hypothetical protein